jgi:anti-sigma factor RsiW
LNNNRIRRLINEYLDGEIGLADKAQLEEIMADNPRVRDEYERLRRLGTLLGLMPEVRVHPYKFRARMNSALDSAENKGYFTPQRAFATAMLIVMVVFAVTFGLYAYQHQIINASSFVTTPADSGLNNQFPAAAPVT